MESMGSDGSTECIKKGLARRHDSSRELMKFLEDAIESQRAKIENIAQSLHVKSSAEG